MQAKLDLELLQLNRSLVQGRLNDPHTEGAPFIHSKLPPTELPPLTVITGVNGAGKTHLLRAIERGVVRIDCAPDFKTQIRYFDWTNLVPNNAGQVQIAHIYSERDQLCEQIRNKRLERVEALRNVLNSVGLLEHFQRDPWEVVDIADADLARLFENSPNAPNALQRIRAEALAVTENVKNGFANNQRMQWLIQQLLADRKHLATVSETTFINRPFGWNQGDLFQQSFAEMFLAYFELKKNNLIRRTMVREGQEPDSPPLSDEEFIALHGEPPWDFVNETIQKAGLSFEIDHPRRLESTFYRPQLKKKSSGAAMDFADLSSGERVLMSFAFCLYYSLDKRQTVVRPKVLLFDEIDAPLHPSMARTVMQTIKEVLVEKEGMNVILVTHSPSTVAVASDESIFLLEPDTNRLTHESKRRAVATLTAEIPTLSISFDGRRQVFVESQKDAERFDALYKLYSPDIKSERSLVFIGVGGKGEDGKDRAAGCDQVRRVVKELSEGGNDTVLGLIDWDGRNDPNERVAVLAAGKRYAVENCLLDPLLVAAAVLKEYRPFSALLGHPSLTYAGLREVEGAALQSLSDAVQCRLLEVEHLSAEELLPTASFGGLIS